MTLYRILMSSYLDPGMKFQRGFIVFMSFLLSTYRGRFSLISYQPFTTTRSRQNYLLIAFPFTTFVGNSWMVFCACLRDWPSLSSRLRKWSPRGTRFRSSSPTWKNKSHSCPKAKTRPSSTSFKSSFSSWHSR